MEQKLEIPSLGQMVIVRQRPAIVEDISEYSTADETLHAVEVRYIDGWNYPERDSLIWQREWNPKVIKGNMIPKIFDTNPDSYDIFTNFINAYRWSTVNKVNINESEDNINLIAPWQSAIQVEDYQLYPLMKALLMPRISLLLADDVGLGKTIEAGLIISELVARGRLKRAMIVCPASLQLQWKEELKEKFNLDFEIIDRKKQFELQKEFGINTNPWNVYPRVITSMDYIRQPDIRESFKAACDKLTINKGKLPWNMLVVDEAHNFNPTIYGDNSQRYETLKELGNKFEHKIFLTATPHNGYTHTFTGLLELLDPVRFSQMDSIDDNYKKHIDTVMIRRLKKDLNSKNKQRFALRNVESINIDLENLEQQLFDILREFKKEGILSLKQRSDKEAQIGQFLFNLLTKRLLSDPYAFACTWWNKIVIETDDVATFEEVNYAYKRAEHLVEDDIEKEQRENELLFKSSNWLKTIGNEFNDYVVKISSILNEIGFTKALVQSDLTENKLIPETTKIKKLIELIEDKIMINGEFLKDERIIIFTEYKQTLNYIMEMLKRKGYIAPYVDCLYGGMDSKLRQNLKERFNNEESNLKILIATDAASEGVNLQNGCRYVLHYDIPWNPMRMEQRNGRVDRHGQRRDIYIYHFTSNDDSDMSFLDRVAYKIEQVREDLGSVSQIIDGIINEHFKPSDDFVKSEENIDLMKLRTTIKTNVKEIDNIRAFQRLKATELQLSLSEENLFNLLAYVIKRNCGDVEEVESQVYRITKVPHSWKGMIYDTLEVKKGGTSGLPKITFNPQYFKREIEGREFYVNKEDTVLIRLAHPIMQKAMLEVKKELWSNSQLSRWTLVEGDLPIGIDQILKLNVLVEVVNKLGEKIHQEVLISNYQIVNGELIKLDSNLNSELKGIKTQSISNLQSRIDELYVFEDELEDSIKDSFKEIVSYQKEKLLKVFLEKLNVEKAKETKLYDERLELIKNDKVQRKITKIIKQIEKEVEQRNTLQLSLFEDEESKVKENIKRLEKQKEILEHNANITRELLKDEKKRVLNEMLPKKYSISNLQIYPLGIEVILAKKENKSE